MVYEIVQCKDKHNEWLVQAIDFASEGEVYSALFYGLGAKERAEEYAAWKNGQPKTRPVVTSPQRR